MEEIVFSLASPAYELATNLIVISLVLSALALGISRALKSSKLWSFGSEELMQALINLFLLGAIMGFGALAGSIMGSFVNSADFVGCEYFLDTNNSPIAYSLCSIEDLQSKTWTILDGTNSASFSLGVLSSIDLDFNVVSASPFSSLSYSAGNYSIWTERLSFFLSALELNRQFLFFIAQSAFSLFLPIGLLLRMFFATRKLGGALMAGAIGFFIIYPLLYCAFVVGDTALENSYNNAFLDLDNLSISLSFVPTLDWGKNPDMAGLIDSISGEKILEKVNLVYRSVSSFIGAISVYAILYPLISLAITLVSVRELALLLGSEFRLDLFEKV